MIDRTTRASRWVRRHTASIPVGGLVLDLACGRGRHSRWLLDHGYRVLATDIDVSGVQDLDGHPRCKVLAADLESGPWPFTGQRFAGIVMVNYLHRPLLDTLATSLVTGGVLIIDTFAAGHERYGRPRNPDFLLEPGELLTRFGRQLEIVAYEHGFEAEPKPAVRQRLCAVNKRQESPLTDRQTFAAERDG